MSTEFEIWRDKSMALREREHNRHAFEAWGGGQGVELDCTTTSARVALVGYGGALCITNRGYVFVSVAWGDSSVIATTAYYSIPPGQQVVITPDNDPTYVAAVAIGTDATSNIQICRGIGE